MEEAVHVYTRGVLLKAVTDAYPSIPRRTITDRGKCIREIKDIKRPGPQPVLSEEVAEDLKSWIVAKQKSGVPVSRDGGLWDENKKHAKVRVRMATDINGKEYLVDHEVVSDDKEGEVRGLR